MWQHVDDTSQIIRYSKHSNQQCQVINHQMKAIKQPSDRYSYIDNNSIILLIFDCLFYHGIYCDKNKFWPNKKRFEQIRCDFLTFSAHNTPYVFDSLLILGVNMNNIDQLMAVIVLIHHITIKFNKLIQYSLLYGHYNTIIIDGINIIWIWLILPCNFGLRWLPKHNT